MEGALAYRLARRIDPSNALGWGLQTAMLGYPSLNLLQQRRKRRAP